MGKVNGGAKLSYTRVDVIVHRLSQKAVLLSKGLDEGAPEVWVPLTCLSYSAETRVQSMDTMPAQLDALEVVQWKAKELGWLK